MPSMPPPRCTGHLPRRTPASRKPSISTFAPSQRRFGVERRDGYLRDGRKPRRAAGTLAGPGETIASASAHEQLAAALASLANSGETIGSAAARDELTHGVDASCEDLGNCILKHFGQPVRAYRVGPASPHPSLTGRRDYGTAMQPTIAVIPFSARNDTPALFDVGNLIADSVIWRLSKSANLKVISRLSTAVFRGRANDLGQVSAHLGATYVLSGAYVANAGQIMVTAELSAARNDQVVWTDRLSGEIGDLLRPESELADRIARAVHFSVFDAEVEHVMTQPLPTLESYSLLLGSIKLMHRSSKDEFLQTRKILDELINRHARIAAPRAWLGNWYILRVTRGWSEDRKREAAEALSATHAALDRDPSDALALATEGFVYCHLLKDLETARKRCNEAVDANPSHALGWLYLGTVNAFKGEGAAAVEATRRAMELSRSIRCATTTSPSARRQSFPRINTRMPKGLRARRWCSTACTFPRGGLSRSRSSLRGEWMRRAKPWARCWNSIRN